MAGNLDREILRLMLSQAGVADKQIVRAMPGIMSKAQKLYREICPDLRHRVCPGVRAFLGRLRRRGIGAGLVTGNLSRIGWHKVRRAGLRDYFEFGAFSDMGFTRAELAAKAIRQARRAGLAQDKSAVYLVGDHLNDIRAARANGISIISVTTGPMTREELAAFSPDFLLDDIRHLPLEIIEG